MRPNPAFKTDLSPTGLEFFARVGGGVGRLTSALGPHHDSMLRWHATASALEVVDGLLLDSLRLTTTGAPQNEAEHSQTNCQCWHQSNDKVAVWRGPRHCTSCDEGSGKTAGDCYARQLWLRAIALTCAIHDMAV
jgi:hypothetical protein